MKNAEILLTFMDELQMFIETINQYIEFGIALFIKAKEWVLKIISYFEKAINKFADSMNNRGFKLDLLEFKEEDLFV